MNINWLTEQLVRFNIPEEIAANLAAILVLATITVAVFTATIIFRKILLNVVTSWLKGNKYKWDDPLIKHSFFNKISWFIPLVLLSVASDSLLHKETAIYIITHRILMAGFVVVSVFSLTSFLTALLEIDMLVRKTRRSLLQGYIDAAKIIIYIFGVIFIISIFTDRSPWGILSVLGGLTAVTMLVFKDSILGFVASIQLSSSDMLRLGDWIEMEQYGADGDVISISIHTVKVQNWDKTITTIPTYALVSSSFKNWRGMSESSGRRIKRSINIDLHSIGFLSEETLEKLNKIEILKDYLNAKDSEITSHNASLANQQILLNCRRQTNIGVFRAYVIAYLKQHKDIHQQMTFLVRQLAPTDHGLPLQIYVFSRDQRWVNYEDIQSDIFDHLIAALPEFDLRIFQAPSGFDFRSLASR